MIYCKMPGWDQRTIRDMKVGDIFMLGKYTEPYPDSEEYDTGFVAEAWIEKTVDFIATMLPGRFQQKSADRSLWLMTNS